MGRQTDRQTGCREEQGEGDVTFQNYKHHHMDPLYLFFSFIREVCLTLFFVLLAPRLMETRDLRKKKKKWMKKHFTNYYQRSGQIEIYRYCLGE